MKNKKLFLILFCLVTVGLILGQLGRSGKPYEKIGYALDTQIRIVAYGKNANKEVVDNAYKEILRLDKLLSNFNGDSETARLNKEKKLLVSNELKSVIEAGIRATKETGGCYDLTVFPLSKLWNYKKAAVPSEDKIKEALLKIDVSNIEITGNTVTLKNGAEIDVSSIAKGYIADYITDYLLKNGVENALVDAGGNIKVIGSPESKKDYFNIGIRNPELSGSDSLGTLKVKDKSVVTSGIYERNFEYMGKTYHHIIDTKTGYPAISDVISATVISKSSTLADAYATAIVVMGSEAGLLLIEKTEDTECIIVTNERKIKKSEGIKDFELTDDSYSY